MLALGQVNPIGDRGVALIKPRIVLRVAGVIRTRPAAVRLTAVQPLRSVVSLGGL